MRRLSCIEYVDTVFGKADIKQAGLAQSVERQALNLMVEGSSPSFGESFSWAISSKLLSGPFSVAANCVKKLGN